MDDPLIRLENVSVLRGGRTVLADLDWRLEPGEHWAVLGGNGAGKSTFIHVLRGDLWPVAGGRRSYCLDGHDSDSPLAVRGRIALVSPGLQEVYLARRWHVTGREVVLAGVFDSFLPYTRPSPEQRRSVDRAMELAGVSAELAGREFPAMSTGQARRVLIARALASRPDVLLLDEYLDGLDAGAREETMAAIEGASVAARIVCAANRLEDLPGCVTHGLVLRCGRQVTQGRIHEVAGLLDELPEGFCPLPEVGTGTSADKGEEIIHISGPGPDGGADVVLDGRRVLRDVRFSMVRGEQWALLGGNGAGKTTLLRLILGEVAPYAGGAVSRFGLDPEAGLLVARRRIGVVSAELQAGYAYDVIVEDAVLSGFFQSVGVYREISEERRARAADLMASFGLEDLADRRIRTLSYGQLRRVMLARALAADPDLLLLDEPLSGLDGPARQGVLDLVERLAAHGVCMIFVTHRPDEIPRMVNRVLVLDGGRVVFRGTREEYGRIG